MININKEILDHLEKLLGREVSQEDVVTDKLVLHRCINLFEHWATTEYDKFLRDELKKIDKTLHPASLYHPVSPGLYAIPDYDDIQFYCGMAPDCWYWTMDLKNDRQTYHLWEFVYTTPKEQIKKHIVENSESYMLDNTKKLEWLKRGCF